MNKFKIGDLVYYNRIEQGGKFGDTLPCEVIKVNRKTLVLDDGKIIYKNVRPSSVWLQKLGGSNG